MTLKQEDKKYKLLIVGDENIGKTSILKRFITDKYSSIYEPTIGLDVQSFKIMIDNQAVFLMSFDISGQNKFNILIPLYSNNADIILLIYDITKYASFNNMENWIYLLNIHNKNCIIGLIGNKLDLEHNRKVEKKEAKNFADKKNFFFHEVSALNGDGIKELFSNILSEQIKKKFILKEMHLNQIEEKFGINNDDDDIVPIYIENEDKNTEKIRNANKMTEKEEDQKGLCKCVECLIF